MTDFRRPDLDLWEEEDPEDARPTIVAERPSAQAPEAPSSERRSDPGRSTLMQRLIERGELEAEEEAREAAARGSVEDLRDSEIDRLRVTEPGLEEPVVLEHDPLEVLVESEPATEDAVPTQSVKAPKSATAGTPQAALQSSTAPRPNLTDREVTERIPLSGMAGSIAPAAKTVRPAERERRGMAWWQAALAAVALLVGGWGLLHLRRNATEKQAAVSQPQRAEPAFVPSAPAEPPAAEEPAAAATSSAPEQPEVASQAPEEAEAEAADDAADRAAAAEEARRARAERRAARALAEPAYVPPVAPEPAVAQGEPSSDLPEQPSREQVNAALNAVLPELRKCVGDRHDTAEVTLTVRPAGFVSYAVVTGAYAGSAEGSCIARSVKSAKFPPFSDAALRITYPFQL